MNRSLCVALLACGCASTADSDTGSAEETGDSDTVGGATTGAFVVPHGADTNGDGYIDTLYWDEFAFAAGAGSSLHVAVDNGPEGGNLDVRVADANGVVENWSGDVACTYPAAFDPESGCVDATWTVPSTDEFRLRVSIIIAADDPAAYALTAFTLDSGAGPVGLPIDLVADDLARPL